MLEYISDIEKIYKECNEIQKFLEITCSEDLNEIAERGNDLTVYLARTSKLLADAKFHQDKAFKASTINVLKDNGNIPASLANKLISACCEKENYIVNWCDRLNSGCVHQIDWLRSLMSKGKEEMKLQQFSK